MLRRIASILVLMMVIFPTVSPLLVEASSIDEIEREMDRIQRERDELAKKLAENKLKFEEALAEINALYARKATIENNIATSNAKINKLNKEIPAMEKEASNMMMILQRNKNTNFLLEALFNPDNSMGQSFRKTITASKLSETATNTVKESIKLKKDLAKEVSSLELQRASLLEEEKAQSQLVSVLQKENKQTGNSVAGHEEMLKTLEDQKKLAEAEGCKPGDIFGVDCAFIDSATGFIMPTTGKVMSDNYGPRPDYKPNPFHNGIDIAADKGMPIYSIASGTVISVGYGPQLGNFAIIQHNVNGQPYLSSYNHMSGRANVSRGQKVTAATQVGKIGNTGLSTGPHLHMTISRGTTPYTGYIDPRTVIKFPPIYTSFSSRYY